MASGHLPAERPCYSPPANEAKLRPEYLICVQQPLRDKQKPKFYAAAYTPEAGERSIFIMCGGLHCGKFHVYSVIKAFHSFRSALCGTGHPPSSLARA